MLKIILKQFLYLYVFKQTLFSNFIKHQVL